MRDAHRSMPHRALAVGARDPFSSPAAEATSMSRQLLANKVTKALKKYSGMERVTLLCKICEIFAHEVQELENKSITLQIS
ncbi:Protein of unknown function, partial [Gryllus bimaculatus]